MGKKKIMSIVDLNRHYGLGAEIVLAEYLKEVPKKAGQPRQFQVMLQLPSGEDFLRMQSAVFSKPIPYQIEEAFKDIEELRSEIIGWDEKLPAAFKREDITNCVDSLSEINKPAVPKEVSRILVLFVPKFADERPKRRDVVVERLRACIAAMEEEEQDSLPFVTELESVIKKLRKVTFPPMYAKDK